MDNNNPNEKNILQSVEHWVETQGYNLEVKVANLFQRNGFGTVVSTWYTDYETNTLREIDVLAEKYSDFMKSSRFLRVDWHISCKTSYEKPWVVFLSESQSELPLNFAYASICSPSLLEHLRTKFKISSWNEILNSDQILLPKKIGHGIAQAFSSNADIPYQALMSAIKSSAYSIRRPESIELVFDGKGRKKTAPLWNMSLPVVVIDTNLYECVIDTQDKMHISEVKESCVRGRKIQFDNYLAWPLVHIVTASEVDNFARRAMNASEKLIEVLSPN